MSNWRPYKRKTKSDLSTVWKWSYLYMSWEPPPNIYKKHHHQIYIYIYIYIRDSWKVHRLTKVLTWIVIKCGCLFFDIALPLALHTLLLLVLPWLNPIDQKVINSRYEVTIWTFQPINFLSHPRTYIYIYIYI